MPSKNCCYAPKYTERVTIQQDSRTANKSQPDYTGAAFKTGVACRIISTGGDETFRGRQLEASVDYVVEMPYFSGVKSTMRLLVTGGLWKDSVLGISHVKKKRMDGGFVIQELYCTETPPV